MIRLASILAISLSLLTDPVAAGQSICSPLTDDPAAQRILRYTRSAVPARLGAAWLPAFERLDAAIPSLSPREEKWLEQEEQGGGDRWVRAASSREFTLRAAKNNASGLLKVVRRLSAKSDRADQAGALIWFAYILTDPDAGIYLERLLAWKVIQREVIPKEWTFGARNGDVPLHQAIREKRLSLARHILICTLPSVIDVRG